MKYFLHFGIYLTLALSLPTAVNAKQITISYFERPPYYLTNSEGKADGFLVQKTRQILKTADIDASFLSLSPNKIIYVIKHANVPHCSIGWFKKAERELFAKFTKPIYQNQPLILLTKNSNRSKFQPYHSLGEIFKDQNLVMARMSSFSYGAYVDRLMEQHPPTSLSLSKSQTDLLHAIDTGKATYMLVAPEEAEQIISAAHLSSKTFIQISLADIPRGNNRYLMCNKAVSNEVIDKLNFAIDKLAHNGG